MRVHRGYRRLPPEARGAAVAIGNFDGVHLGHRAVIEAAAKLARAREAPLGVVTFEPHPREVLQPESAPPRLTSFARKAELLAALGVARLFVLRFEPALMRLSPEAFVREILLDALGVRAIAVGANFRFGYRRAGTPEDLIRLAGACGVRTTVVPQLHLDDRPCSSTRIRAALRIGDVALAARLLGYPYELRGGVVRGDRIGRTLGYPTANLRPAGRRPLLPATGIYVVRAAVRRPEGWRWHPAVASLGFRPAVGGRDLRLEVHLLDGEHELYGQRLRVSFLERLRGEEAFESLEALRRQIARDCAAARAYHGLETARA